MLSAHLDSLARVLVARSRCGLLGVVWGDIALGPLVSISTVEAR